MHRSLFVITFYFLHFSRAYFAFSDAWLWREIFELSTYSTVDGRIVVEVQSEFIKRTDGTRSLGISVRGTTEKLLIVSWKSDLHRPPAAPLNVRIIGSTLRLRVAAPRTDPFFFFGSPRTNTPTTETRLP